MLKKLLLISLVIFAHSMTYEPSLAADQQRDRKQIRSTAQDRIYGSHLMSQQERAEYHTRMRIAKSDEEREQIRKEHHERMKVRAVERGVTLPDEPPARGGGMGARGGRR